MKLFLSLAICAVAFVGVISSSAASAAVNVWYTPGNGSFNLEGSERTIKTLEAKLAGNLFNSLNLFIAIIVVSWCSFWYVTNQQWIHNVTNEPAVSIGISGVRSFVALFRR